MSETTRVENYRPPSWPDDEVPKQARLRVLLDPAGHPFCINVAF